MATKNIPKKHQSTSFQPAGLISSKYFEKVIKKRLNWKDDTQNLTILPLYSTLDNILYEFKLPLKKIFPKSQLKYFQLKRKKELKSVYRVLAKNRIFAIAQIYQTEQIILQQICQLSDEQCNRIMGILRETQNFWWEPNLDNSITLEWYNNSYAEQIRLQAENSLPCDVMQRIYITYLYRKHANSPISSSKDREKNNLEMDNEELDLDEDLILNESLEQYYDLDEEIVQEYNENSDDEVEEEKEDMRKDRSISDDEYLNAIIEIRKLSIKRKDYKQNLSVHFFMLPQIARTLDVSLHWILGLKKTLLYTKTPAQEELFDVYMLLSDSGKYMCCELVYELVKNQK